MARIFRALLVAAVNAIKEFLAFATKGCLQDTLIFDIVGNITILGKKFTNFSPNNYIKVPLYSYENSLEFVIHYITQPDSISNAALIMPNTTTGGLMLRQNSTIFYAWAGNSSHWNALNSFNTGVPIDVNQERWIKITVNGTSISFFYSTDGETWTAANTGTLSAKINFTNGIGLGAGIADSNNNYSWGNGTILLEDCYFQYDDTKLVPYLYPKQLNDTIKLNDGIASSNYDWSACQDNEYGQFTATGTIEAIKEINNEVVYVTAEPEQDNKEVQIKTGQMYYAWTDSTNTYYTDTDSIRDSDIITLKNASIKGTLNNNNGVYSGFSDSNYLTCENFLNNTKDSFEVKSKIYLTGTSSSNCSIIDTSQENSTSAFRFEINSSMKLQCRLSNTIGSYEYFATLIGTTTLQLNTWYFVKVTYDSSTGYALYLTQDESDWHDPEATTSNTSMINHTQSSLFIGDNASSNASFPGYIDLTKTSITINGNVINLGETITLYKTIIYDENFEPLNPQPTLESQSFTQPVLTASGTMGGDSFAVSAQYLGAYYPWYPFASNANTDQAYTWAKSGNSGDYIMYNPDPIKIISFEITNRNEGAPRSINGGTVYGSNDGVTYTELTTFTNSTLGQNQTWTLEVNSSDAYKYYKLSVTSNDYSYVGIGKIQINAKSGTYINGQEVIYDENQNILKDLVANISTIDNTEIQSVTINCPTVGQKDIYYYGYTNTSDENIYITDSEPISSTTFNLQNAKIIGTINNDNGVFSNFSRGNYIQLINPRPVHSFDFIIKCKPGSGTSFGRLIQTQPDVQGIVLNCTTSSVNCYISRRTSYGWEVLNNFVTGITMSANTDVYVRITWNDTDGVYRFYQSDNGIDWETKNYSDGGKLAPYWVNNSQTIGANTDNYNPWNGSVDMNETKLTIDNIIYTYKKQQSISTLYENTGTTEFTPSALDPQPTFTVQNGNIIISDNTYERNSEIDSSQTITTNPAIITTSANITTSNNDNVVSGTDWHIFNITMPQNMATYIQSGGIEFTPLNMPLLLKNNTGVGLLFKNGNTPQYRNHWVINRDYDLHYQELQFSTNVSDPTILVDINNVNTDSPYYLYSGDTYKYKISKEGYCDYEGSGTATYTSADGKTTTVEAELVASNGTVDVTDYEYTLNNTGNMVLTKYIGNSTDVTVPNI